MAKLFFTDFKYGMNILPINFSSYRTFKGYHNDDDVIGYDDAISQERRNYIRAHYNKWNMLNIYDKNIHLTDYQIGLLIHDLEQHHDIQNIPGTTIYRGQTLVDKPNDLRKLKKIGINTIVDLVGYGTTYKEAVNILGMDYFTYNIFENWWDVNEFEPKHIDKLVEFLKVMQKGHIYIGCQHGANDTDIALILNDFFNPLMENKVKTKISPSDSDFSIRLNTIYDMLSETHKKELGWNKEFEKRLIKKLISI